MLNGGSPLQNPEDSYHRATPVRDEHSMKIEEITNWVPHVRPHNRLRDGKVYFMLSKRSIVDLSSVDLDLYHSIDGTKTVGQLENVHPDARLRLVKWREANLIELVEPVEPPQCPHIVVIEPHMDDAILSAGGRLLHRRGHARITILSVVKWSNFTSYLLLKRNFLDVHGVTRFREQESALVAKLLGAEHRSLEWRDAPIRFWPGDRWDAQTVEHFNASPQGFVKLFPSPADISLLTEQLAQTLLDLDPDELWIPMGFGDHIDHRMTRAACLRVLAEHPNRFSNVAVSMYEDLPYATGGPSSQMRTTFIESGAALARATEDISDVFDEKLRLVSVYASQFKLSYMEPALRKAAETEGTASGKRAEAFFRLEKSGSLPSELLLSRESTGLEKLQSATGVLMFSNDAPRRLTIMALPTGQIGNWERIRRTLIEAFPDSEVQIYAADAAAWQLEDERGQVNVQVVRGGRWSLWAWMRVLLRELPHPTPTIVLWQGAYASEPMQTAKKLINYAIRSLLPLRQVLFARALWDFCCMIEAKGPVGPKSRLAHLELA
jgi:LmbE family N-acetylglucosaminyl deacetylase